MKRTAGVQIRSSIDQGVREGQKSVRDGDYTYAVLGLVLVLAGMGLAAAAFIKAVLWFVRR